MEGIVFVNNEFAAAAEARISIFDRGYLFGDGVYEIVPVINSSLLDKEHFLQRLDHSLNGVGIAWPYSREKFVVIVEELMIRNNLREGVVYVQVTRGVAPRDFSFPENCSPCCMAFAMEKNLLNNPLAGSGVSVVTVDDIRWKRRDVKSIALLGQCLARQEAAEKGGFEGWMVEDGLVTEGTSSTAYIVKNETIITRPFSRTILPGIRRKSLLRLAGEENISIEERPFSVAESLLADEAFLSSETALVLPVTEINGHIIGNGRPGRLSLALRQMYIKMALHETGAV